MVSESSYLRRTKDPEHSLESARWYWRRLGEMAGTGRPLNDAYCARAQLYQMLTPDEIEKGGD